MIKKYLKQVVSYSSIYKLKKERFVFLFHDISPDSEPHHSPQYSITPGEFVIVMDFIRNNFQIIGIDDIVSNQKLQHKKPLASIVFDDGFYSTYKIAYPYLLKYKLNFALFINKKAVRENQLWFTNLILNNSYPKYLENVYKAIIDNDMLSLEQFRQLAIPQICDYVKKDSFEELCVNTNENKNDLLKLFCDVSDLKEMMDSGMATIHSHGLSHITLTGCPEKLVFKEIEENRLFVESITDRKEEHFAIPFGKNTHYNKKIVEQCKQLGYKYLYSSNPNSFNERDIVDETFVVPRISIANGNIEELLFSINMNIIKRRNL